MSRFAALVASSLLLVLSVGAASPATITLKPFVGRDYWQWVDFVSPGPFHWLEEKDKIGDEIVGRGYRVATLQSEETITVLLEERTIGDEGCCAKLVGVRELDLYAIAKALDVKPYPFTFVEWLRPDAFAFCLDQRPFVISRIGTKSPTVEPVTPNQPLHTDAACGRAGERQR